MLASTILTDRSPCNLFCRYDAEATTERTSSFFDHENTSAVGNCASIVDADGQRASHLTAISIQETVW